MLALLLALLIFTSDRPARAHDDDWIPVGYEQVAPAETTLLSRFRTARMAGELLELRHLADPAKDPPRTADVAAITATSKAWHALSSPTHRVALQLNRRGFDPTAPPSRGI